MVFQTVFVSLLIFKIPPFCSLTPVLVCSQRLRPTVHDMITAEIKARAAAIEAARPRVDQVSKLLKGGSIGIYVTQKNGKSGSLLITGQQEPTVEPMGKAQTAARELLLSILDLVTHILGRSTKSLPLIHFILLLEPFSQGCVHRSGSFCGPSDFLTS